jgi:hypothetical protein
MFDQLVLSGVPFFIFLTTSVMQNAAKRGKTHREMQHLRNHQNP